MSKHKIVVGPKKEISVLKARRKGYSVWISHLEAKHFLGIDPATPEEAFEEKEEEPEFIDIKEIIEELNVSAI